MDPAKREEQRGSLENILEKLQGPAESVADVEGLGGSES